MPPEPTPTPEQPPATPEAESKPPESTPEERGQLAALKAEREKRQAVEAELAKFREERAEAERAAAEKRGEFEALYGTEKERADTLAARVAEYEARETARLEALTARNKERSEALPDHLKPLVPPGLDPDALSDWLTKASELAEPEGGHPRGTRSRGAGPQGIPAEALAEVQRLAAKWSIEPELVWKRLGARHRKAATEGKRINL